MNKPYVLLALLFFLGATFFGGFSVGKKIKENEYLKASVDLQIDQQLDDQKAKELYHLNNDYFPLLATICEK